MIAKFLTHLEAANRSPETIIWYEQKLRLTKEWIEQRHGPQGGFDTVNLQQFLVDKRKHCTPQTVQGYWRALHAFGEWGTSEGLMHENPVRKLKRPKVPIKRIDIFSHEEYRSLLRFAENNQRACEFTRCRDTAMLWLFYDTGMRESELINLCTQDLDLIGRRANVTGKGAKDRTVPFGKKTAEACRRLSYMCGDSPFAIPRQDGGQMARSTVYHRFQLLCIGARVRPRKVHAIRHTYGCRFMESGGRQTDLMYFMGHSTMEQTNDYTQWSREQQALENFGEFSPGDRLFDDPLT